MGQYCSVWKRELISCVEVWQCHAPKGLFFVKRLNLLSLTERYWIVSDGSWVVGDGSLSIVQDNLNSGHPFHLTVFSHFSSGSR